MLRKANRGNGPGSTKTSSDNEIVIEQFLPGSGGITCLGVVCNDFVLDIDTRCFSMNNINSAICGTWPVPVSLPGSLGIWTRGKSERRSHSMD